MIQRGLKPLLERHKVFRRCIEFQTGFPPTKTKKLPISTAEESYSSPSPPLPLSLSFYPENFERVARRA